MVTPRPSASVIKPKYFNGKRLLLLAIILLLLYVIIPQISDFKSSFHQMSQANITWLALGLGAVVMTYIAASCQYYLLALKPIKLLRTFAVQCAGAFTNRLLPAGIGGISLNVAYLKKSDHNNIESGVVIAVNNFLGLVGNIMIVLVIALIGVKVSLHLNIPVWLYALFGAIILIVVLVLIIVNTLRHKILSLAIGVIRDILRYRLHPMRLFLALVCAVFLTLFYAVVLYCSMQAIGWDLSFGKIFVVFIGSVVVATITPTPGGLIGAEAALTAGFVAYGLPASDGLAIALLYRLLTYWLPFVVGFGVFQVLMRKRII